MQMTNRPASTKRNKFSSANDLPTMFEQLETRRLMAVDLTSVATQNVPAGTTLYVPLTTNGASSVSYSATSSNSAVKVAFSNDTTFLKMSVAGRGDMVFQLFNDVAPHAVAEITGMARAGFYNNQRFHRVIKNFVIQAGDPKSKSPFNATSNVWGTGGPATQFDDEFNRNVIFNGNGQLAMANSGKDTNGSQFFITVGAQRGLDFNHTIFGQLVRGFDVLTAINGVATDSGQRPTSDVVISSVSVITDKSDGVLKVTVPTGSAQNQLSTITVTAKSGSSTDTAAFKVNKTANATNDPPILGAVPESVIIAKNGVATIKLPSVDPDGGEVSYSAQFLEQNGATGAVNGNVITVTPAKDYTGPITLVVGVVTKGASSRGSTSFDQTAELGGIYDSQEVFVGVGEKPATGGGVNVDIAKDVRASNALVASFTDGDTAGAASDWRTLIDWGDGTASSGTVVKVGTGKFDVRGSHTYNVAGTYRVTTQMIGSLGALKTFSSTAYVRNFAGLTGGTLTVNGSGTNDVLSLAKTGSGTSARINVTLGGVSRSFAFGSVTKIVIDGLDGNDSITLAADITQGTDVKGGNGRDTILGGGGKDTIHGGNQNDSLVGGDAVDSIFGDQGNDTLIGNAGNDRLDGGTESDSAENGTGDTRVSIETLL